MRYIEAPWQYEYCQGDGPNLFLAGGITGCPDWQVEVREALNHTHWTVFNPRRADFPIHDPRAAEAQIRWEYTHLRLAHAILFWFPVESIQPIALYELGAWSMTNKPLFVGTHPDYPRRVDVEVQTKIARPDVSIVYSLYDLIEQAHALLEERP